MTLAIEAEGLHRSFGSVQAVRGVDLQIPAGIVYGVLGPNGAGKTTTVRMLATLLKPDAGTARVLGRDVVREAAAVKRLVSLTGQFASVDEDMTGAENLVLIGRLWGLSWGESRSRATQLLDAFGLAEASGRLVKGFSGGMRRRIDIAASLVMRPQVLFLDEPTTGLDPASRNQVWQIIQLLVQEGTTVLLTTQYLEEADALAARIAVIDHGRVIAEGTSAELKGRVGQGALTVRLQEVSHRPAARQLLVDALGVAVEEETDPLALSARVPDPGVVAPAIARMVAAGYPVAEFSLGQPSLDEVFLTLTGHRASEETAA